MDVADALAGRRSCRNFSAEPVPPAVLDGILSAALRAPSAGNTSALDLVVLEGPDQTGRYWDVTLPAGPRRDRFAWPGLLAAPVLVIPTVRPHSYVERYAEPDKAGAGLGRDTAAWTVPYWFVDGGAAVMAMLLAATGAGLGSLLFGQFAHGPAVASAFGIPADRAALGTVALGRPAPDRPGRSAARGRQALEEMVHRSRW